MGRDAFLLILQIDGLSRLLYIRSNAWSMDYINRDIT